MTSIDVLFSWNTWLLINLHIASVDCGRSHWPCHKNLTLTSDKLGFGQVHAFTIFTIILSLEAVHKHQLLKTSVMFVYSPPFSMKYSLCKSLSVPWIDWIFHYVTPKCRGCTGKMQLIVPLLVCTLIQKKSCLKLTSISCITSKRNFVTFNQILKVKVLSMYK